MTCEIEKEVCDKLKEKFQGSDRTMQIQVLNLWREFEFLKMKELEIVKECSKRLIMVVNQIKLLGEELSNKRIVEKVLIIVLESIQGLLGLRSQPKELFKLSSKTNMAATILEKNNLVKEKTKRRNKKMTTSGKAKKEAIHLVLINRELVINLDMWRRFLKTKQIKRAKLMLLKSSSKKKKFSLLLLSMLQIVE
ncbi:putative LRR receptor-like serine/threonine-protein kinase [Gossypium australe]|uniref:Putative LRR receptor-like serine/threonine-protein kinase n=1 Tax=Gossypium australe TaxID=47621 RepID=A0A5B6WPB3_9ROSI|nr:putative LRR receptor-like serine/threonine-protein kinase [Gossypium australe]